MTEQNAECFSRILGSKYSRMAYTERHKPRPVHRRAIHQKPFTEAHIVSFFRFLWVPSVYFKKRVSFSLRLPSRCRGERAELTETAIKREHSQPSGGDGAVERGSRERESPEGGKRDRRKKTVDNRAQIGAPMGTPTSYPFKVPEN